MTEMPCNAGIESLNNKPSTTQSISDFHYNVRAALVKKGVNVVIFIYKVMCLVNDKVYVGQTKRNIEKRFKEHSRSKKSLIGKAMQKYGKENFKLELLEVCETREEANRREIFFISEFNCIAPNGYNLTSGGWGHANYHFSKEFRAERSLAMKKRFENPAERARQSDAQKKHRTKEERDKKAAAMRDFYREHPEAKAKKSEDQKIRWSNPEEHAKQSAANRKRHAEHPITDETRQP